MPGRLTIHVLDTTSGKPAEGMTVDLLMSHGDHVHHLDTVTTNADGRLDKPLLAGAELEAGTYELDFHVGDYFAKRGVDERDAFLEVVPVRFIVSDPTANYHVPLIVSPYGYSTYRGS